MVDDFCLTHESSDRKRAEVRISRRRAHGIPRFSRSSCHMSTFHVLFGMLQSFTLHDPNLRSSLALNLSIYFDPAVAHVSLDSLVSFRAVLL